jgi:hypothetical protein
MENMKKGDKNYSLMFYVFLHTYVCKYLIEYAHKRAHHVKDVNSMNF